MTEDKKAQREKLVDHLEAALALADETKDGNGRLLGRKRCQGFSLFSATEWTAPYLSRLR